MKKILLRLKNDKALIFLWGIVLLLFIGICGFIEIYEEENVIHNRISKQKKVIENISMSEVEDETAPIGIRQEYRWVLEPLTENENCMAFYVRHQYVKVYFDEELIYQLMPKKEKWIGKTLGAEWVNIPVYREDVGKEVKVEIFPVYQDIVEKEVTFLSGTQYDIFIDVANHNIPIVVISVFCILLGIVLVAIQLFYYYRRYAHEKNLIYLGIFSIMLGVWKMMDMRLAPLVFPIHSKTMSYLALILVPFMGLPLMYYMKSFIKGGKSQILDTISRFSTLCIGIIVGLHICNIVDLRDNLFWVHLLSIIVLCAIGFTLIINNQKQKLDRKNFGFWGLPLMIIPGAVVDISEYLATKDTSGVFYVIVSFLLYVLIMVLRSISENRRKAYMDFHTGLFNKSCCNELLEDTEQLDTPTGLIMIDMNYLKYTNDTFGHEAGDKYILEFARVLCESIPAGNFIGRFGGDEFICIIYMADERKMNQIIYNLERAVQQINESGRKPQMSYALGYALSSYYPGSNLADLLKIADQNMYEEKQRHHKEMGSSRDSH